MEFVVNVTSTQEFRPWEVEELTPRVKIDIALAQQCPQIGSYQEELSTLPNCLRFHRGNSNHAATLNVADECRQLILC